MLQSKSSIEKKEDKYMSMEVNRYHYNNDNSLTQKVQAQEEKTKETQQKQATQEENKTNTIPEPKDKYIPSKMSDKKTNGLYRLGQDENGNPKVFYDDLKKADSADKNKTPKANPSQEEESECTANTDQVDQEIQKLKEEKKQLKQQIQVASDDKEKVQDLKKKLAQIEAELSQKDNDSYRKQNTIFS